jgi:hypothetical protein
VNNIQLAQDEVLVSFNAEAIYPSVSIPEALKQFVRWLKTMHVHGVDTIPVYS